MSVNAKLTNLANIIRSKTGSTEKLSLDEMATEVEGIKVGGSVETCALNIDNGIYLGNLLITYTTVDSNGNLVGARVYTRESSTEIQVACGTGLSIYDSSSQVFGADLTGGIEHLETIDSCLSFKVTASTSETLDITLT